MTAFAHDPLLAVLAEQTDLLLRTVERLDDAAVGAASRLPGWTRGLADLPDTVLRAGLLECATRLDVGLTAHCAMADGSDLVVVLGDHRPQRRGGRGRGRRRPAARRPGVGVRA